LTKSEQKLATLILETPTLVETHTATELAQFANVSKATAARFFRALGYTDFEEVKVQAREERNRTQPYSYSTELSGPKTLGRTIGDHLDLELNNLTRTFEEMGTDTLKQSAQLIADAPKLWFLGLGADGWFARYGKGMFSRIRPNVHVLGLEDGAIAEELAMTGPRDVIVLVTLGPQPKLLRSVLSYTKTTRVRTITFTDHGNFARAKQVSDVVFRCHIANYGLIPTHTTLVSTLRLMALSYAGSVGDTATQRSELIDQIDEELDFMD
jgi:DNA-binding MurR/RpiR family transcriptional regulator